jgi:hypothetical protein
VAAFLALRSYVAIAASTASTPLVVLHQLFEVALAGCSRRGLSDYACRGVLFGGVTGEREWRLISVARHRVEVEG